MGRGQERTQPKDSRRDLFRASFADDLCLIYPDRIDEETREMRWHALGRVAGLAIYLVVHVYREQENGQESIRIVSARAAEKMTSEDIWNNPLTEAEKKTLRRHAYREAAGDDSRISLKSIPALSAEQLAGMTRLRARQPKIAVSVRLDPRVLEWLESKGDGHLTRINDILANIMDLETKKSTL